MSPPPRRLYTVVAMYRPPHQQQTAVFLGCVAVILFIYFFISQIRLFEFSRQHYNITVLRDILYYYFSLPRSHVVNYVRWFYYINLRIVSVGPRAYTDHSAYYNIMGEIFTKFVGEVLYRYPSYLFILYIINRCEHFPYTNVPLSLHIIARLVYILYQ